MQTRIHISLYDKGSWVSTHSFDNTEQLQYFLEYCKPANLTYKYIEI